ncbi:MAG: hypothetical protein ACK4ND_15660 [Cytophagaceae bacterium]
MKLKFVHRDTFRWVFILLFFFIHMDVFSQDSRRVLIKIDNVEEPVIDSNFTFIVKYANNADTVFIKATNGGFKIPENTNKPEYIEVKYKNYSFIMTGVFLEFEGALFLKSRADLFIEIDTYPFSLDGDNTKLEKDDYIFKVISGGISYRCTGKIK